MNRHTTVKTADVLSAAGNIPAAGQEEAKDGQAQALQTQAFDSAGLEPFQKLLGHSDEQFKAFLHSPRNRKILSRLKAITQVNFVFKIVKAENCVVGHKVGEKFIVGRGRALDTRNSAEKLCPFLMPPITRLTWLIQERICEGLDPQPLFHIGQCDDVGNDCGGWGRVLVEAHIEKAKATG